VSLRGSGIAKVLISSFEKRYRTACCCLVIFSCPRRGGKHTEREFFFCSSSLHSMRIGASGDPLPVTKHCLVMAAREAECTKIGGDV
jgi:hypothetical protein